MKLAITFALLSLPASATMILTYSVNINSGFTVSNSDLLQTHIAGAGFTGSFVREGEIGIPAFNNGIYGGQGNQGNGGQAATADQTNTATFILDSGIGLGYDLTSIEVFSGWDQYRGGQQYAMYYDTVSTPGSYILLASVFNNAVGGNPFENTNTRARITDTSGILASHVRSLRFQFGGDLTAGFAGYREIDVMGSASIPEPKSLVLSLLASGALLSRRSRRA